MEIKEVRKRKAELEREIWQMLSNFYEETGVTVSGIDYDTNGYTLDNGSVVFSPVVRLTIEV